MNHTTRFSLRTPGLVICLTTLALCQSLLAMDFYVSPTGNDHNPGSKASPLATLEGARDTVRKAIANGMKSDVTVYLGAGTYFIEKPVEMDDRDSGRDGHTIIYKGAPNLGTRIYGGKRITGWKKLADGNYEAEVPGLKDHYTLYENEQAANGGIFHVFPNAPEGDWKKQGDKLIYQPRNLPIENQVVVLGTAKDVIVIKGRSMQQIAGNLIFDGLYMIGSDFAPAWKLGDCYETRWDGEYDGRPWGGKNLGDAVVAPDMRHGQFYLENARKVTIRNSKLYGAGFMGVMANLWAQESLVENCWIENAGCNGLFFMGWESGRGPFKSVAESYVNKKHVVRNNVFYDIGRFSNYGAGMYFNFSGDNLVEHNVFHGITHYAVTLKGWRPMILNEKLSTNRDFGLKPEQIKPFDMQQIKFYGEYVITEANQGEAVMHSRNTIIRYNDMSQSPRFGDDMGMISMWGAGTGNVWEYNACHDGTNTSGWEHWLHVLFNDDGSHQATLRGNIIYWVSGGSRSRAIMSKGNDQNNIYNIIADCDLSAAATIQPFICASHDMIWTNNVVSAQIGTLYEGGIGTQMAEGKPRPILKSAEKNLYFYQPLDPSEPAGPGAQNIKNQVAGRNKAADGIDKTAVYADPMFDRKRPWWDSQYTDYQLKPESPALKLGFKQTDMAKIGLQPGFPFDLTKILGSSAGKTHLAADFTRIYKNRITNQQVRSRGGEPLYKNSWVRYDGLDFGAGQYKTFEALLEWTPPALTFEAKSGGKTIKAKEYRDAWTPIPYWEVSQAYTQPGKKGPELFDIEFAPEKDIKSGKWTTVTDELVSRATVRHPLGVVNCDVANGENHSNSAAYMRANLYFRNARNSELEIRGVHGVKVWVNGKLVFSQLGNLSNSNRANFPVKQGWNEYVVKIVQDDQPWKPATSGYGNFWASVTTYYPGEGTYVVPGGPGKEVFIDPALGTAVEIRLGAPDGKLIGTLPFKQSSCPIEKTSGRQNIFLVFPKENVQSASWFRFR
jgi:hypothetical protein